jgi:hypothetical protein
MAGNRFSAANTRGIDVTVVADNVVCRSRGDGIDELFDPYTSALDRLPQGNIVVIVRLVNNVAAAACPVNNFVQCAIGHFGSISRTPAIGKGISIG